MKIVENNIASSGGSRKKMETMLDSIMKPFLMTPTSVFTYGIREEQLDYLKNYAFEIDKLKKELRPF
jgi:hypothetical protein